MMIRVKNWQNYFSALMLCGLAVCANVDEDRSVISSDQSGPGPDVRQGVAGRVTTSDHLPVKGAFIQPRSLDDPSPPIPEIAILTDDEGRYTWPLLPGNYLISVSVEGCQRASKHVAIESGQVVKLDFILQCETDHMKPQKD
jgi:hypothetical protein